mgnify:FL=1|tara:strand:+ start:133 stop:654 length:522 start_codon:yes stop_codon:yes gene_type:complete
MNRIIHLLPLAFFIVLVVALHNFLDKEDDQLASALLDKSFPTFSLPSLETQELVENRDLSKLPALVNVWATWCITCRVEHPFLMKLKQESVINIYGINYKDQKKKAIDLLEKIGNPYEFSIFDQKGILAIDLGVYGAPETFLIDQKGVIKVRHVGALTPDVWEKKFKGFLGSL